jgi:hypothetical protein
MRPLFPFVVGLALAKLCYAIEADVLDTKSITLTTQDIVKVTPGSAVTREQFEEEWGQFEVLVPKQSFPIPAPNCRKNVILRMPGVTPNAPSREQQLAARWDVFQAVHALREGKRSQVEFELASGPYLKTDKQGRLRLQYCNAYIRAQGR